MCLNLLNARCAMEGDVRLSQAEAVKKKKKITETNASNTFPLLQRARSARVPEYLQW